MRPIVPFLALLSACADASMGAFSGDLGVTTGGSQDNAYARQIVESGGIPRHEHFTAEGIFSEHDLPLEGGGADCNDVLCPVAAVMPFVPVDGSGMQVLAQIGFDTALSAETFVRRPLSLAVAVDVSGSMSDGKLEDVQHALGVMIDQLGEEDELALVAFDDRAWLVEPRTGMDARGRARMRDAVASLATRGGTDIEAGMALAYDQIAADAQVEGVEQRVMLFTDAQPNTGATGLESFVGMARYYGQAGIGISVFGVGLDMGTELADAISKTRGGNYHYLATSEDIRQVFDEEFDYIVTPLAYDLEVEVSAAEGLTLARGWGMPVDGPAEPSRIGASTLFLSARDGGMGLSLVGERLMDLSPGDEVARFSLRYVEADGDPVSAELDVRWGGGGTCGSEETAADDVGVYKMAGLVDAFLGFEAGADFCDGVVGAEEADARIVAAAQHLERVAASLSDADVAAEAELQRRLAENLRVGGIGACASSDVYVY